MLKARLDLTYIYDKSNLLQKKNRKEGTRRELKVQDGGYGRGVLFLGVRGWVLTILVPSTFRQTKTLILSSLQSEVK